ncbi:putative WRKY transcription factor 4 [Acorus gramineus]|uniref:WRKY transcription factor 4 n=1 Tax=Acorus gramineus TaxID=55184 RepID=A0AAV9BHT2_ACOGR|nr:putative WRKY transcription factor 4 [Acorus gramineus]
MADTRTSVVAVDEKGKTGGDGEEAKKPKTPKVEETLADDGGGSRIFSQLLAGAMAPPPTSSEAKTSVIAVSAVEPLRIPVVTIPCYIAQAPFVESAGFQGQFAMSHQAVLASVTAQAIKAQAQMQMQAGYPPSSGLLLTSFTESTLSALSPRPLQQLPLPVSNDNASAPDTENQPSPDQESQSDQVNLKVASDGYNWRKYGQKQVKSSESSRSYYKCTQASCSVKKKVERCPDGRVTEITYRGQHNHERPQKIRSSKERGGVESHGGDETPDTPSGKYVSESSTSRTEQSALHVKPEPQVLCSSDGDGDADTKTVEKHGDEPDPKRRLVESIVTYSAPHFKAVKEPKVVVQTASDAGLVADGYRWRKYGQKFVKGNPNPRSYYKCTFTGCAVRKHVERTSDDAKAIMITYEGKHNHDLPTPRNGHDSPATAVLLSETSILTTKDEQTSTSDSKSNQITGEKELELGGEMTLESAQTLLSISLKPASEGGAKNTDSIKPPIFNESHAAVSV